eukprot:evm.model.scf_789.1 EVM.evm.TU.scf_789.1   scf_789:1107-4172(+)
MADSAKPEAAVAGDSEGASEGASEQTPRRASSLRKAGSKLKKAFTPRRHSASSEDSGELESPSSEGSDKKKGGFFRKLSQKVRTPRSARGSEASLEVPEGIPEERSKEDIPEVVQGVAGAVADSKPAEAVKSAAEEFGSAVGGAKDVAVGKIEEGKWELVEAAGKAKDEGEKRVEGATEAAKAAIPDTVVAAAAASVHTAAEHVSLEVEAAQAKTVMPVQQAAVATREVDLPKPAQEKEAEAAKEAPKESKKSSGRRRRPLIPLLGIAIGIVVIAVRMAK